MNKQQLLKNLKENIYCRIQPSEVAGVGVFAICDIPKGTNPFVGSGDHEYIKLNDDEIADLDEKVKKIISDFFIKVDGGFLVPECGFNGIDISYYCNFSKDPNVEAEKNGERLISKRDIAKGEELTINY